MAVRGGWAAWPVTILAVAGLAALVGCGDPSSPYGCTTHVEVACWAAVGATDMPVSALATTRWGLFAGTLEEGIHRWDPAGGVWVPAGLAGTRVLSMLYLPQANRLLAGIQVLGVVTSLVGQPATLQSTVDGTTWIPWNRGIEDGTVSPIEALAVDPEDQHRLYAGTDFPIARSDNGGAEWYYVFETRDAFGGGVHDIHVSRHEPGRVWAALTDGVGFSRLIRTQDYGAPWTAFQPDGQGGFTGFVVEDPNRRERVWAGASGRLYVSDDIGGTWDPVMVDMGLVVGLVAVGDRVVAAGLTCDTACLLSSPARVFVNGGIGAPDTWTEIATPPSLTNVLTMLAVSDDQVLLGTGFGGVWALTLITG